MVGGPLHRVGGLGILMAGRQEYELRRKRDQFYVSLTISNAKELDGSCHGIY